MGIIPQSLVDVKYQIKLTTDYTDFTDFGRKKAWSSIAASKKILATRRLGAASGVWPLAGTKGVALRLEFIALGPTACHEGACASHVWAG